MNAALECFVERLHTVGRDEQQPGEVLELPQKDGNQCVSLEIVQSTLLEEDVGLVD